VMTKPANCPDEGQALTDILHDLATICGIAETLRMSLEPLSAEEVADGMEALTTADIQHELRHINSLATRIALEGLRAEASEWYAVNNGVE
jgi:hypothetical protein